jgi:hypothetical protein
MARACHPERWVGLGFIATMQNAPPEVCATIDGIASIAPQIAWATSENYPDAELRHFFDECRRFGLEPAAWAWCEGDDVEGEAAVHAKLVERHGLKLFIANMEEPYDAHGDVTSPRFDMAEWYFDALVAQIASDVELACTTTERWGSNHEALRQAGCTHMPQEFTLENGTTIDKGVEFSKSWGWTVDRIRPLVQVYETNGKVPDAQTFLDESAKHDVGVVPYILEQAFGGQGRELLTALVPAIVREPASTTPLPPTNGDDVAQPLPPGAFDDCAKYETQTMKRADGKDATAFTDRAGSLKATRARVLELEDRIIALEGARSLAHADDAA